VDISHPGPKPFPFVCFPPFIVFSHHGSSHPWQFLVSAGFFPFAFDYPPVFFFLPNWSPFPFFEGFLLFPSRFYFVPFVPCKWSVIVPRAPFGAVIWSSAVRAVLSFYLRVGLAPVQAPPTRAFDLLGVLVFPSVHEALGFFFFFRLRPPRALFFSPPSEKLFLVYFFSLSLSPEFPKSRNDSPTVFPIFPFCGDGPLLPEVCERFFFFLTSPAFLF